MVAFLACARERSYVIPRRFALDTRNVVTCISKAGNENDQLELTEHKIIDTLKVNM
jgi:hypothetical protein